VKVCGEDAVTLDGDSPSPSNLYRMALEASGRNEILPEDLLRARSRTLDLEMDD
jgi:hypothetical protein